MSYNPDTATPREKWAFRMRELKEFLQGIPFTTNQRIMIDHHLRELESLYGDMRIAFEDTLEQKSL